MCIRDRYALNYMLTQNGIDPETDVTIEWKSEHSECVASLAATENAIAMLPQPFVTTAQTQNENLRVALDITEEWEKLASANGSDATLITGVVVGRKDFVEQNPQLVQEFLSQYEQDVYKRQATALAPKEAAPGRAPCPAATQPARQKAPAPQAGAAAKTAA